jgi:phage tail sheath gpL-like
MATVNPNLPLSYVKPTIAVAIDTQAPTSGNDAEASTLLLWGEQLAAGIASLNSPQALTSVTDAVNYYGQRSPIVRDLRAALSQNGVNGAVQIYGVGVSEPSGGTAGTAQIVVSIPGGSNPTAAGGATVTLGGVEQASVSWTTTDTATTIGAALATALNACLYTPFGTWTNASGTVTATFNIKGARMEDYPLRFAYTAPSNGVYFGPGTITIATNATGAGSISIVSGATAITAALAGGETPTAAAVLVAAAVNGGDYPLDAGTPTVGAIPLYFAPSRDYRRAQAFVTASTGVTVTLLNGSITSGTGTGSTSSTYAGTLGAGFPTLTTAISNVRAIGSFGKWACPWFDATTAGSLFSAISTDGNGGPNQNKGQTLTLCATGTYAAASALPAATSPAMNVSQANNNNGMRGAVCLCLDAAQPGSEVAARVAGLRAASDPFTNYDGLALTGTSDVPLLLPAAAAIGAFNDATQNTAITNGLTPLAVVGGALVIIFGRTTLGTTAADLWDWSWIDQADAHRRDFRAQAAAAFAGAALIAPGTIPSSRKDVDPAALVGFEKAMLRRWEAQGTYDGADANAGLCTAAINPSQRSRADCTYPESPKVPLHTIGVVAQRALPPIA